VTGESDNVKHRQLDRGNHANRARAGDSPGPRASTAKLSKLADVNSSGPPPDALPSTSVMPDAVGRSGRQLSQKYE
jgi:hypothetical protein